MTKDWHKFNQKTRSGKKLPIILLNRDGTACLKERLLAVKVEQTLLVSEDKLGSRSAKA